MGPNEDGRPEDIIVMIKRRAELELVPVPNGVNRLAVAKAAIRDYFAECGDCHWGTQTDVVTLAEALNVGFIIFADQAQGGNQWIQYLNYQRADYPFWMLRYWEDPVHFRLAFVQNGEQERGTCFFTSESLPLFVKEHFNVCHRSTPIGSSFSGGVS